MGSEEGKWSGKGREERGRGSGEMEEWGNGGVGEMEVGKEWGKWRVRVVEGVDCGWEMREDGCRK